MPRQFTVQLTPPQASYVIQRLVETGAVTENTVRRLAGEMADEVTRLERKLAMLRGFDARESRRGRQRRSPADGKPVSPAVAASRRLQGQYLGLIRQLPANRRNPFKKIAAEQGREKAVQALRKELGS